MAKPQSPRVKVVACLAGKPWVVTRAPARHIEGIADERMAGGSHVDADLVRTAGGDPDFHERCIRALSYDSSVGDGRSSAGCCSEDLAETRMRHGPDRHVDCELAPLWTSRHESEVGLQDATVSPLAKDPTTGLR